MSQYPIRAGSSMWALQVGIVTYLFGDSVLKELAPGLYDGMVPEEEEPKLPYVLIGEMTENPDDRLTTVGREVTVTIHAFSNYRGAKEAKRIGDRITFLMDQRNFAVDGWNVTSSRLDFSELLTEPDDIRHGVFRFRIKVQPIV